MTDSDESGSRSSGTLRGTEPPGSGVETLRQVGVLVVDDQDYMRFVLNAALRDEGYLVWLAAGGREALELYRAHGGAIDVVVLDVSMPGLDGPQTLAALRGLDPGVRCCFLSGGFGCYTEGQLRGMGAGAVLYKPARAEEITRTVRLLAGPVGAGQPSGERPSAGTRTRRV